MAPNFPHHIRGAVLWDMGHRPSGLRLRGYHPLRRSIPGDFGSAFRTDPQPITPHSSMVTHGGSVWATPRSLAVTRGIPFWFLFLPLLGCFRSGGSRSQALARERGGCPPQEVPLGDPRIEARLRLPGAYRSLPRPSSAPKPRHPPAGVPPLSAKAQPILLHSTSNERVHCKLLYSRIMPIRSFLF